MSTRKEKAHCGRCEDSTWRWVRTTSNEKLCPVCIEVTDDIPREELDAVVVIGRSLSGMFHAPDQNGEPLCGRQPRKQHPNQANGGIYGPKDPAVYPNHELCPDCRQRYVQKSDKITATDGGNDRSVDAETDR